MKHALLRFDALTWLDSTEDRGASGLQPIELSWTQELMTNHRIAETSPGR
jgi:hypothetical protein